MQVLKTDGVSSKIEKPVPAPSPPDAPHAPSSASVSATAPAKSAGLPPSAHQPPQAALGVELNKQGPPLVEGTGAKEEYGYIVTNQRYDIKNNFHFLFLIVFLITNKLLKSDAYLFFWSK